MERQYFMRGGGYVRHGDALPRCPFKEKRGPQLGGSKVIRQPPALSMVTIHLSGWDYSGHAFWWLSKGRYTVWQFLPDAGHSDEWHLLQGSQMGRLQLCGFWIKVQLFFILTSSFTPSFTSVDPLLQIPCCKASSDINFQRTQLVTKGAMGTPVRRRQSTAVYVWHWNACWWHSPAFYMGGI